MGNSLINCENDMQMGIPWLQCRKRWSSVKIELHMLIQSENKIETFNDENLSFCNERIQICGSTTLEYSSLGC